MYKKLIATLLTASILTMTVNVSTFATSTKTSQAKISLTELKPEAPVKYARQILADHQEYQEILALENSIVERVNEALVKKNMDIKITPENINFKSAVKNTISSNFFSFPKQSTNVVVDNLNKHYYNWLIPVEEDGFFCYVSVDCLALRLKLNSLRNGDLAIYSKHNNYDYTSSLMVKYKTSKINVLPDPVWDVSYVNLKTTKEEFPLYEMESVLKQAVASGNENLVNSKVIFVTGSPTTVYPNNKVSSFMFLKDTIEYTTVNSTSFCPDTPSDRLSIETINSIKALERGKIYKYSEVAYLIHKIPKDLIIGDFVN